MNIIADENIPLVKEAFSHLGQVSTLPGRDISSWNLQDCDILLVRSVTRVDEQLLQNTPVQFVASATAGINHIDLDYLENNNIGFANAPGSNATSAAEYVIAAICYWSLQNGRELGGDKIGIIGCGHVGSRVAAMAEQLGMQCVLNDPPLEDRGLIGYQTIDEALACDIVTLHVPLNPGGKYNTVNLLDSERINRLRPDSLFINASRGEVVEEPSLLARLKSRCDLSVVLDVWHKEPKINPDMLKMTLLGTPHIAGYSTDGKIRGTEMIYRACCEYLNKKPRWKASGTFFRGREKVTSIQAEDIRLAVLQSYDILSDSKRLKRLLEQQNPDIAGYFDNLRKHYPIRREFADVLFAGSVNDTDGAA